MILRLLQLPQLLRWVLRRWVHRLPSRQLILPPLQLLLQAKPLPLLHSLVRVQTTCHFNFRIEPQ